MLALTLARAMVTVDCLTSPSDFLHGAGWWDGRLLGKVEVLAPVVTREVGVSWQCYPKIVQQVVIGDVDQMC